MILSVLASSGFDIHVQSHFILCICNNCILVNIVLTNVKQSITEIQGKFRSLLLTYTLYIDCGRGWYGINCNETCGHCRDLDQCSKTNGTCLTGCDAGFQGELCNISMLIFYIANKVKRT